MKKIILGVFVMLLISAIVFAQAEGIHDAGTGITDPELKESGQGTGQGLQTDTKTENSGDATTLQNQIKVKSGNYENANGEQMQVQNEAKFKLKVGDSEVESDLTITQEQDQNRTKLKTQLSNGKNAEIKIMPNTASETAIQRLQLKVCSSENNCSIQLKEVGTGEQAKLAYEVKAQKQAKVLGMFKTQMQVQAQVDAETGETIQTKKPWWAFLASEPAE
ncbi:MAG: hypothetical protein WCX73_02175 [Candidatus Pacearchaeota archaeon]|jgi:hypothetical protein